MAEPQGFFRDAQGKVHPISSGGSGPPGKIDRFGTGDKLSNNPEPVINSKIRAIAQKYVKSMGLPPVRNFAPTTLHPKEGRAIADAYEGAKDDPSNPETRDAYKQFNKEIGAQWDALTKGGIKMEPWEKPGQPYQNSVDMHKDVNQNGHLWYFKTTGDPDNKPHALMSLQENDKFRAVHDVFGHAQMGNRFGPIGETNAYLEHSQMFSPKALRALTTETLGQNATYNFGKDNFGKSPKEHKFAVQKATLLPEPLVKGIIGRRDSGMAKTSFAYVDEEDYFSCPCHKTSNKTSSASDFHTALKNAIGQFSSAPQGFFRDNSGRVHPISTRLASHLLDKIKSSGGFTVHAKTGEDKESGYAVSPYESREAIFDGHPAVQDIEDFMSENSDLLRKPDHYIGGWDDKKTNKTYLDVSIVEPTASKAEDTARKFHQIAYHDLSTHKDIAVTPREEAASRHSSNVYRGLQDAFAEFAAKGPLHQSGGSGANEGAPLPGQSRPDMKPEGFFHDKQGGVHPIFAGAGGEGTGFDGKSWKGAGNGKAVNPYEHEPTAKQKANADAALKGMGLTPESLRANYEKSIAGATDKESSGGKTWYPRSNNYAAALAKHSGTDTSHAAAVIASLSPHNSFIRNLKDAKVTMDVVNGKFQGRKVSIASTDKNKNPFKYMLKEPISHLTITPADAQKFMSNEMKSKKASRANNPLNVANYNGVEKDKHGKDFTGTHDVHELPADILAAFIPHLGGQRDNFTRAFQIARGADPDKVLHGNKVRSFYNNNLDPSGDKYNSATIDTHMIQEGRGKGRGGYGQSWVAGKGDVNSKNPIAVADKKQVGKVFSNPALYRIFDQAVKDVSQNHGLRAHQGQAVLWNINKNRGLESLGKGSIKQDRGEFAAAPGSLTTQYDEKEDGWLPEDPDLMTDEEFRRSVEEDKASQKFALETYLKNTGKKYEEAHHQEGDPPPENMNEF